MILTLDNSTFTLLVNPGANPPPDPSTGNPLRHAKDRIEYLIDSLEAGDRLVVPTPVLAEVLVGSGDAASELHGTIQNLAGILIAPFDQRAAVESVAMTVEAQRTGDKRGGSTEPWQKVKFDRQIIAIARVANSDAIYSDDGKLCEFARSIGMETRSTWELPMPEKDPSLFD